ncbi:TPA: phosphotransferase, partial [Salmonella enterica subsp. enterica serovar Typhimurium var. 5-]|nr:phosphotransferase [Salmonella enterica subsp. enterica serovar Typhimurium var. 5-]
IRESPLASVERLYDKLKEKVFPYISIQSQLSVSQGFELFIKHQEKKIASTALIHGDFGASNILWDSIKGEITGVIDFGGSGPGDPAYDFAGLLSSYGEEFFNQCIDLYPEGQQIKDRVNFYRSTFALQEALHGIENNDDMALKNGIRNYI